MSNRIRLLFHCALDGPVAYVGRQALLRMQELMQAPATSETRVVSKMEWIKLGRPEFLEKKLIWKSDMTPDYKYRLPVQAPAKPPKLLELTTSVATARLLWKRLPDAVKKHCQLMAIREGRNNCWRRSVANPYKHGWAAPPKPSKKAPVAQAASQDSPYNIHNWSVSDGEYPWETPEPTPPASPATPTPTATAGNNPWISGSLLESVLQSGIIGGQEAGQLKASALEPAHTEKVYKKAPKPKKYAGHSYKACSTEPVISDDSTPVPTENNKTKTKLRLGIWS